MSTNWHIAIRPGKRKQFTQLKSDRILETIEQLKATARAKVVNLFRVIKQ